MTTLMRRWNSAGVLLLAGAFVILSFCSSPAQAPPEGARKILVRVTPQYPNIARAANLHGTVKIAVVVAPAGSVKSMEIVGGHPILAQSAESAVRQWKWEPMAHETTESVEIRFNP
jgi:TonB family protein